MNRLFLILSIILMFVFLGCDKSSEKGKELLEHQLKLVGIPQDIVVNICQDDNGNGTCDKGELQAKVTVNRNDTVAQMWEKVKFDSQGRYILQNYDSNIDIIMEIQDKKSLRYDNSKLGLNYKPDTEELSIIQSIVDADFLQEEDVVKLQTSKNRDKIDSILLKSLTINQNLLRDENLTKKTSLSLNLDKLARGLKESNVTKLPTKIDECNGNEECIKGVVEDARKRVELTKDEAKELARTKNVSDGYIVKLETPVKALCSNGKTYESSLKVREKGKIFFSKFPTGIDCNITVPSDATIDTNNNGEYDSDDKIIGFEMLSTAIGKQITPLTTLLFQKRAKGEDVDKFEYMISNFDPVVAPYRSIINIGIKKIRIQKLIVLMEILKTVMRESGDIFLLNLSTIINSRADENIKTFNIDRVIAKLSDSLKSSLKERVSFIQNLLVKLKSFNTRKVDINTFFVLVSDGGKTIEDALTDALLEPLPDGVDIFDFINTNEPRTTSETRAILANKTFYVPYSDNGIDIIEKHTFNKNATLDSWEMVQGEIDSGIENITINGNIFSGSGDYGIYIIINVTNKYIEIKDEDEDGIIKVFFSLKDAKAFFSGSNGTTKNLKDIVGRTIYQYCTTNSEMFSMTFQNDGKIKMKGDKEIDYVSYRIDKNILYTTEEGKEIEHTVLEFTNRYIKFVDKDKTSSTFYSTKVDAKANPESDCNKDNEQKIFDLVNGDIIFKNSRNRNIAIPSDAWIRITPSKFYKNGDWDGSVECKIISNGTFGRECYIFKDEKLIRDAFNNQNEKFSISLFKNGRGPGKHRWDCGEDAYKSLGDDLTRDKWSSITVLPNDYEDKSQEECN